VVKLKEKYFKKGYRPAGISLNFSAIISFIFNFHVKLKILIFWFVEFQISSAG